MGCCRGLCTADNMFLYINIAFAMYAGALLSTAARLAWDPSTYAWFRWLCETQYHVSGAYVLAAGFWLAAIAALGALPQTRRRPAALRAYAAALVGLAVSELAYGIWMAVSLARWWNEDPKAELARRGMDLVQDLKPALLAVDKYRDVARAVYDVIEEMEREAPNNVIVIVVFMIAGIGLQVAALVLARKLSRCSGAGSTGSTEDVVSAEREGLAEGGTLSKPPFGTCGVDCERNEPPPASPPPHWRKTANLKMYTILDKIF